MREANREIKVRLGSPRFRGGVIRGHFLMREYIAITAGRDLNDYVIWDYVNNRRTIVA